MYKYSVLIVLPVAQYNGGPVRVRVCEVECGEIGIYHGLAPQQLTKSTRPHIITVRPMRYVDGDRYASLFKSWFVMP